MPVETVSDPQDLNVSYPEATDDITAGDDHLRNIKKALKRVCWEEVGTSAVSGAASASTYALFGAFVAGYDYMLVLDEAYISGTGVNFNMRVTAGGGTPETGGVYAYDNVLVVAADTAAGANAQTTALLAANFSDLSTQRAALQILAINPGGTTNPRHFQHEIAMINSAGAATYTCGSVAYRAATAVDGIQVYPASGTMTATVKLYRRFRP
jgi:hypothetical protein